LPRCPTTGVPPPRRAAVLGRSGTAAAIHGCRLLSELALRIEGGVDRLFKLMLHLPSPLCLSCSPCSPRRLHMSLSSASIAGAAAPVVLQSAASLSARCTTPNLLQIIVLSRPPSSTGEDPPLPLSPVLLAHNAPRRRGPAPATPMLPPIPCLPWMYIHMPAQGQRPSKP
jgi:hypothetical protein